MSRRLGVTAESKKACLLGALLLVILTASGCWGGQELNARAFVTAVAFDPITEEGVDPGEFLLGVQIPIPAKMGGGGGDSGEQGGGGGPPFVVFETTTKMVSVGIRQLQRQLDRELFFGHTQLFLINAELAATIGVDQLMDHFKRDFRVQRMARIAIIDGEARAILNTQPPISQTPSAYIENLLSPQSGVGINYISDFGRFLVEQSDDGIEPVLPRLKPGKEATVTGGAAVLKNGKFVGWLSNFETRGLNIILNQRIRSNYEVECPLHPGESIVVGVDNFHSRHQLREVNGQTVFQIKVRGQFETIEFSDLHGPLEALQGDLERGVSAVVQRELEQTVRRAQELGVDFLGVGRYLKSYKPEWWRQVKDNWAEEFFALPIEVEVEMEWAMTIRRFGG
ncbi:MAG: Ger(x)C family spore germination protein [Firmicutes bacterium]|nr:Ger(x)C family spore germination protein [Bacillota bacterium]